MKKLSVLVVAGLALMVGFSSCSQSSVKMKTQLDSLNYAFGVLNGPQVKAYSLGGDTTAKAVDAFIKGFEKGIGSDDKYIAQYATGLNIGASLKKQSKGGLMGDSTLKMNVELIKAGLIAGMKNKGMKIRPEVAEMFFRTTMQKLQAEKSKKLYGKNIEEGKKFLEANKKKPGVVTTPDGLQYEVIKAGNGPKPTPNDQVKVNYKGTLINGTVFDTNEGKAPVTFGVGQVIKGWSEALTMMPVGSKWKIYVPAELGYMEREMGAIKPFSTLVFEVELLSIEKAPAQPQGPQGPQGPGAPQGAPQGR
ncbi:MAG: FKBP-type peptidyl-prolyl cis-trans isomerase [Bacteroidota bacterium]|nr:FKBP-type peptidyl-prolyl cis-trans isomerase [Bacteroidota bacterium]